MSLSTSWAEPGRSEVRDRASEGGVGRGVADGIGVPRTAVEPEDAELSLEWVGTEDCPESEEERDGDDDGVMVVWLVLLRRADLSAPEAPFTRVEVLLEVELDMLGGAVSPAVEGGEVVARDLPISRSL